MWASHGLDRFCVRPYLKLGPELQVINSETRISKFHHARWIYESVVLRDTQQLNHSILTIRE